MIELATIDIINIFMLGGMFWIFIYTEYFTEKLEKAWWQRYGNMGNRNPV